MSDRRCASVRLAAAISWILSAPLALAQETAAQLSGFMIGADGQPVAGAVVSVQHLPSGTIATSTTGSSGQFTVTGLRVGGPFRVSARAEGMQEVIVEDLRTQIGQRTSLTLVAQPIVQLAVVEIMGSAGRGVTIGAGSRFGAREVRELPSISRDIKDVVRVDPRAWVDPTNSDALEIAGVNNRYNTITVDGVRQSDDFGLNNNGYPTQRSPLSMDAIESFTVLSAPFSVEYSGFRGSTINVVTKSGTNDVTGSAYYYGSDDSLAGGDGKDGDRDVTFEEDTYGGTIGGPIVRDKLFYFLAYEKLDRTAPQEVGPAGSGYPVEISGVTQEEYDQVLQISRDVYGFDAGQGRLSALPEKDEKILAKIDWNISDRQRASFAYQRAQGNEVITANNSQSLDTISAPSGWYNRRITLDSYSFQLFSDWNELFATELKVARKEAEVRQDALMGTDFAEMRVRTPSGGEMYIGPDAFRHANYLTNDLDTVKLKANLFLGDHTLTVGYEREMLDIFNLFVDFSQGSYRFGSIADFEGRVASSMEYRNAFTNDADDAAATFGYDVDSFYVQDEWHVNADFEIQAGVRMDKFSSSDTPLLNEDFTGRYGYSNLSTMDGRDLVMPRIGFNWQWRPETTIYGGWGLFGGGTPNVWISNSFSNDGVTVVQTNVSATTNAFLAPVALNDVDGYDIPQEVLDYHATLRGDGAVNAVDPDFEVPSQYRWNLGMKHMLPWDIQMSADVIVSDVKDEVLWQDIRLVRTGTAPDGRPRYSPAPDGRSDATIQDLVLASTGGGDGEVYSIDFQKIWRTSAGRFDAYLGYGYQNIHDVNPGTSSRAQSNHDSLALADPNGPRLSTSNYEIEHQFKGRFTWRKAFFGDYETSITLVGERRSGRPYSFTFGGGTPLPVWGDSRQSSRQHQLFYVPDGDVIYEAMCTSGDVSGGVPGCTSTSVVNPARSIQFASDMDAYVQQWGLEKWRGRIVPRNSHSSSWLSVLDLRMSQELPIWRKARGVLTVDVENLANMIDNDWGQLRQVSFPYVAPVVDVNRITADGCPGGAVACYVYRPRSGQTGPVAPDESLSALPSVWRVQLGVRIEF